MTAKMMNKKQSLKFKKKLIIEVKIFPQIKKLL